MSNLVVIGVGGVGSHLLYPLLQYLNFSDNHYWERILLVDGDKFEVKNKARQIVPEVGRNKASATADYYQDMFSNLSILSDPRYINSENAGEMVDEQDVILLCVDNNITKKIVEDYCDTLKSFTLISGGNELYDGNVQIVVKLDGEYRTKKLTEVHPEIAKEIDVHPDKLHCGDFLESKPQISIVNAAVADAMRRMLYAFLNRRLKYYEEFINCMNGSVRMEKTERDLF